MLTNKRRSQRVACDLPVQWKRGRQLVEARLLDLNADGLFFETAQTIPVNQLIDVTIELPSGPVSIAAVSRVCGVTERGVGIGASILAMDAIERARWNNHYRSLLPRLQATVRKAG